MKIIYALIILLFLFAYDQVNAKQDREKIMSFVYCDIVWGEMRFGDVLSPDLERTCRNRFVYLVHKEKAWIREYYRKQGIKF